MNRFRYRQLFLFLAVLILPSLAIVILSRGLNDQARKNAKAEFERLSGLEEDRMAAVIGQAMYDRLQVAMYQEIASPQAIDVEQVRHSESAVALVGWQDGERLVWPWESERVLPVEPDFDVKLREAERAGFSDRDRAAGLYRALAEAARNERQRGLARLGLARTLAWSEDQREDARRAYLEVLNLPWSLTDEFGYSLASYAALSLAKTTMGREVLDRVKRDVESPNVVSLDRTYRLKSILEALQKSQDHAVRDYAGSALKRVDVRIKDLEAGKLLKEAHDLQKDFRKLDVTATQWKPYAGPGKELWLVGKAPGRADSPPLVVVVRAEVIRSSVESDRKAVALTGTIARAGKVWLIDRRFPETGAMFQIAMGGVAGKPLGEHFPDLRVVFTTIVVDQAAVPNVPVYSLWLLFIVPLTFLGGYLLWRDTRREIRMSDMRSQFVSSVSHGLKTPLTAIRMFAETLQIGGTDARTHDEYLETIVNESERLTRLLNNVLDFSRIERGQKTYVMAPTALEDVVNAAVRTMQYPLAEKGFVLNVSVAEGIPPVEADRDAIEQAILNLLTNAMKYSGKRRDIELQLRSENGSALIQVTDHGIGIPENEQKRIFDKFYRAHVPENRAIAGTGLGLALVAHIAEAHRGSVHVKSSPGEGSTFSIRLPLNGKDNGAA